MPDIRDIIGQTSALEKLPKIDQRNQEMRAAKQAIGHKDQIINKQETVGNSKETENKTIKEEQEREKGQSRQFKKKEENTIKENKEPKSSEMVEVNEGKIIDVKV